MFLFVNNDSIHQSEGEERIIAAPGHVISQVLAPGARVVTRRGGGGDDRGGQKSN